MGSGDGGRRLLVVEDNRLMQRMMRELFEGVGYQVMVARNGSEALQELEPHAPEVIISDIIMPVMDGWEFCEKVRSNPATAEIPFLFVTTAREVPDRIRGLRMGADDYITKPFSEGELLARVERMLAKVERLRTLEAQVPTIPASSGRTVALEDLRVPRELIDQVRSYLDERRLLTTMLIVSEPEYHWASVEAVVRRHARFSSRFG